MVWIGGERGGIGGGGGGERRVGRWRVWAKKIPSLGGVIYILWKNKQNFQQKSSEEGLMLETSA